MPHRCADAQHKLMHGEIPSKVSAPEEDTNRGHIYRPKLHYKENVLIMCTNLHCLGIQFTYGEVVNVIIMVSGSASHMRGSDFFRDKQLFIGYRPMDLSKIQACVDVVKFDRNSAAYRNVV